jgi:hypothetical protein
MHENDPSPYTWPEDNPAVSDTPPTQRRRRFSKMTLATAATVGGVTLLAVFNSLGSSTASSSTPAPRTTFTSVPTTTPTPTVTPTVEPYIPTARTVWSAYLDSDDRADVCAESGAVRVTTFNLRAFNAVEDITGTGQYTAAEANAAIDCPKPKPVSYRTVNEREFAKVIRNPDGYEGKGYVVYGEVSQFDSATGLDSFRAQVAHANVEYFYSDGENAMFEGSEDALEDLIDGDVFKAKVIVKGSLSYDTQAGGNTTVPVFTVTWIDQIGHND